VETRAELARRASGFMRPTLVEDEAPAETRSQAPVQAAAKVPFPFSNKPRSVRFPGRILTA
jgi:hypothetical protein